MTDNLHQEINQRLENGSIKELTFEDTFNFECTETCMGNCCNSIDILLDPWDIETISRELGIACQEFVKTYCKLDMHEELNWPSIQLKHVAEGPCTFMLDDGKCSIYPARPRNCRTSPVARAVRFYSEDNSKNVEEKIFMINPVNNCQGHNSNKTWTVHEWFEDCDAYTYYELSDIYLELIDYSVKILKTPQWLSGPVIQTMMPFLFAPDMLREKMSISTEDVDHKEFYKRRMKALRNILTEMAANVGYGPRADTNEKNETSIMDLAQNILLGKNEG